MKKEGAGRGGGKGPMEGRRRRFERRGKVSSLLLKVVLPALSAYLAGFIVLRVSLNTEVREGVSPFLIQYPDINAPETQGALAEQGELFDTAPLFFPTEWNTASEMISLWERPDEAALFESFPPLITLDRDSLTGLKKEAGVGKGDHRIVLGPETWNFFHNLGASEAPGKGHPAGSSLMEIRNAENGRVLERKALPQKIRDFARDFLWSPAVFNLLIDETGRIGQPLMVRSAGVEEVNEALKEYLGKSFLFSGLDPGYYSVVFGP